jgi:uncharacterized protein YcfL
MKKTKIVLAFVVTILITAVSCNSTEEIVTKSEPQTILPASAKEPSVVAFRKAMISSQKEFVLESEKGNEKQANVKNETTLLQASKIFLAANGVNVSNQDDATICETAIDLYASKTQIISNPKY